MNKQSKPSSRTTKAALEKALDAKTTELRQKNRLLEIEAALEKVRNRTLLMKDSSELHDAAAVLFQQFKALDLFPTEARTYFSLIDTSTDVTEVWMTKTDGTVQSRSHFTPLTKTPSLEKYYQAWKRKEPYVARNYTGKELEEYLVFVATLPHVKTDRDYQKLFRSPPERIVMTDASFQQGTIGIMTFAPLNQEALDVLVRFAKGFEFTYTRFLDLQKAEAQALEAQIEAALERVRSRTMGMHKSEELTDVAMLLREELRKLGYPSLFEAGYIKWDEEDNIQKGWLSDFEGKSMEPFQLPIKGDRVLDERYQSMKIQKPLLYQEIGGQDLIDHVSFCLPTVGSEQVKQQVEQHFSNPTHFYHAFFMHGALCVITKEPLDGEQEALLVRFTKAFEQTYTRFLDLQKAEAQAREAQIEAALERVRSRTMGMHKSDELAETATLLFEQIMDLTEKPVACAFIILNASEQTGEVYISADGTVIPNSFILPYHGEPAQDKIFSSWKSGNPYLIVDLSGDELVKHLRFISENMPVGEMLEASGEAQPDRLTLHIINFKYGFLGINYLEPKPEFIPLFQRFAKVFEQTYTRFLDLQKAEAQAREAQIEAALERVRGRTMAMHRSEELSEVVNVLIREIERLDIESESCLIVIPEKDHKSANAWMANDLRSDFILPIRIPFIDIPFFAGWTKSWEEKSPIYQFKWQGEELKEYFKFLFEETDFKHIPEELKTFTLGKDSLVSTTAFCKLAGLMINSREALTEEQIQVLKRFASTFEQTYTRFLDLQRAETQAREAQIEAALERVRARAMAMHSSEDISNATAIVFTELKRLGIETVRCGIIIIEETKIAEVWTAVSSPKEGEIIQVVGRLDMTQHRMLNNAFNSWKRQDRIFSYDLFGTDLEEYYTYLTNAPEYSIPEYTSLPHRHTLSLFFFPEGGVFSFSDYPHSVETHAVFERFANVFALTYRRYLDLVKAEGQARDAVKQASLDRVRAEIASMRTTDDLNRITPLIWRELTTLGVPFFRCGVFIVDEPAKLVRFYLSTPSGESLAAMHLKYGTTPLVDVAVDSWRKERVFIEKWDRDQFIEWTKTILEQGLIESPEKYQAGEEPPEILVLQFVPFKQGMLYVGSMEPLSNDQIELVHALADAFAVAYARYEDFKQLEEAKHRVEGTLTELKSTQAQLIQSEKMASLGELTAGIAHEIQNPLNFVNNFSEVNTEMLEELNEELQNGNLDEAVTLIKDMLENEHKIVHHGRRAEAIVKSMLQHSRGTSGKREPTDINDLADEYLRLAYHGMRARDKSFNATMKTDFDDSIGNLNIVPQEIGRVLLNLITNSFYATTERQKLDGTDYQPTVWVSTKKRGDRVEIRVKDNGTGIPQKVLEKIFQPFFSTKPTGEGTGLGLSLSYDIVKAHGGELKVETEEGNGSEFVVQLPIVK